MRSDQIKLGFERAPHRGLLRATGVVGENDFNKPFIAVCNSYVDVVPGHVHLQAFGKFVKEAIRAAGGVPFEVRAAASPYLSRRGKAAQWQACVKLEQMVYWRG